MYLLFQSNPGNMGSSNQFCLRWTNHRNTVFLTLGNLLELEAFSDVTLACDDGVTLQAHRIVLSACSPFFKSLLIGTQSNHHPIIVLKDIKESDMRYLLTYMYCGEVNVEHDDLGNLLKVAESLKIKGLTDNSLSEESPSSSDTRHSSQAQNLTQHSRPYSGVSSPQPISAADLRTQTAPLSDFRNTYSELQSRRIEPNSHSPSRYKPNVPHFLDNRFQPSPRPRSPTSHYPTPPHSSLIRDTRPQITQSRSDTRSENKEGRDIKDISIIRDTREHPDPHRNGSPQLVPEDLRDPRRPLSIIPPSHSHISDQDSPSYKRKRLGLNDTLISPNPILQTALAHQTQFGHSELSPLMSSMLPIPGIFGSGVPRYFSEPREIHEVSIIYFKK